MEKSRESLKPGFSESIRLLELQLNTSKPKPEELRGCKTADDWGPFVEMVAYATLRYLPDFAQRFKVHKMCRDTGMSPTLTDRLKARLLETKHSLTAGNYQGNDNSGDNGDQ